MPSNQDVSVTRIMEPSMECPMEGSTEGCGCWSKTHSSVKWLGCDILQLHRRWPLLIYCLTHFKGESNCDVKRFFLVFFCIFPLLLWKKMWRIKVGVNKSNPELNTYCSDHWWACTMLCILILSLKRHLLSQTGTNLPFKTNCDISFHILNFRSLVRVEVLFCGRPYNPFLQSQNSKSCLLAWVGFENEILTFLLQSLTWQTNPKGASVMVLPKLLSFITSKLFLTYFKFLKWEVKKEQ